MASLAQFKNKVKVIAVARIGAEFKKSKIIKTIIETAKANGHVATGKLTTPSTSRSITPFSDDRWLIRKDAVKVSAVALPSGEFAVSGLTVRVRYGLNGKYQNLSQQFAGQKKWFPPVDAISKWIHAKKGQGEFSDVADKDVRRVAYAIALKQEKEGIKKTNFAQAFFDRSKGVKATLNKGINSTARRLESLYATSIERSILKMIKL